MAFQTLEKRSRRGVSIRKSQCIDVGMMLENSIRKLRERLNKVLMLGASSWNDESGNLVTASQGLLWLWRKYFSTLLQGVDGNNTACRDDIPMF